MVDDNNKMAKVYMVRSILAETEKRKSAHYARFRHMKYWSSVVKMIINGSNAISVCSMVMSFAPVDPAVMVVALVLVFVSQEHFLLARLWNCKACKLSCWIFANDCRVCKLVC